MTRKHPGFEPKPAHQHAPLRFPDGFWWGTATSAHQVEGWNDNSDWWEWEHKAGTIADGQMSGRGADHYHLYRKDIALMSRLHQNAHRFSIEWSRIEPEPGRIDRIQLEHYFSVLQELRKHNIRAAVTLHHFTNPVWFERMGGFRRRENCRFFLRYAEEVIKYLHPYVNLWTTFNEPNIYVLMGYLLGVWPPGEKNRRLAYTVFGNLAWTHRQLFEMIHKYQPHALVGCAQNVISFDASDKHSALQWASARGVDWLWNHWFIEKTRAFHDYIGINYYVHKRIKSLRPSDWSRYANGQQENREHSDLDWEIYPPGFSEALSDMASYRLPIFVTENGISTQNDHRRARYIVSYLKELYHAIQSGVDVRGYFHWSLMDNFEWDKGFKARFGLVEVDFNTLQRKIRGSAEIYATICRNNAIPHELLQFVGHGVSPKHVLQTIRQSEAPSEAGSSR